MRNSIQYGHPDLLRRHEVAKRLYMSASNVDLWVKQGRIPTVPHPLGKGRGRKVYFHWPDVAKALRIKP